MARQDGIEVRIKEFCDKLTDLHMEWDKDQNGSSPGYACDYFSPFVAEYGSKFARIVQTVKGPSRSVYCFVDLSNGDILKSAGWKTPAKGKRGSIWNEDCDVGMDKPANIFGAGLYAR